MELNNRYFNKLKGYDDSSKDLLETIKKFEYKSVPKKFKLIDEVPQMNLFVNVGEDAKSAYDEYERIKSIEDPFKRKKEFLKIKRNFYQYIISVPEHAIKGKDVLIEEDSGISVVDETYYDIETGFKAVENKMIII